MVIGYISTGILNFAVLLVLCYMVLHNEILERFGKRFFLAVIGLMALIVVAEIFTTTAGANGGIRSFGFVTVMNVIVFSLLPVIPILLEKIFGIHQRIPMWHLIPGAVNLILTVLSGWYGIIFRLMPDLTYTRGPMFYMVYVLSCLFGLFVFVRATVGEMRYYQQRMRVTLSLLFIFVVSGSVVQILFPNIHLTCLCVTYALVMYYAYICELSYKYDVLTEVFNRQAYESELKRLEQLERASVVSFDVDDFKKANDTHGHTYGDLCLRTVALTIRDTFSSVGFCYRFGGDEFCVLSENTNPQVIEDALRRFESRLDELRRADPKLPNVSYGYGTFSIYEHTALKDAFNTADRQLYALKRRRKAARGNV